MAVKELQNDDLSSLLAALCDGTIDAGGFARLERRLESDPAARRWYMAYLDLHGELCWDNHKQAGVAANDSAFGEEQPTLPEELPPFPILQLERAEAAYPRGAFSGWALSYIVATVVLAAMLLGAWGYKISHIGFPNDNMAKNRQTLTPGLDSCVGRIVGMKDCRWGKGEPGTIVGASVPLGRKYAIESGLLQIEYASGANVILEGPCEFTADSRDSGFLRGGKLVARVEKKVASGQWPVARKEGREERGEKADGLLASATSAKPQAANPEPRTPNPESPVPSPQPPLSTLHSPHITIATPSAIVTDLGTEFGVEVDKSGNTISHVFRGSVKVQTAGDADNYPEEVILRANESARVEKSPETNKPAILSGEKIGEKPQFVRCMVKSPEMLDLLDIVASGDGAGRGRERGIDPLSGVRHLVFFGKAFFSDDKYRTISWSKLIDGVFIPTGGKAVQVDSFGHEYDGFPTTSGGTYGSIWARSAEHKDNPDEDFLIGPPRDWMDAIGSGRKFMTENRGLLVFHANSGITFNLEAIREIYRDKRPARLKAVGGMIDVSSIDPKADGLADIWILVDGRLKLKREAIRVEDGPFSLEIEIGPNDRFLTLAATDGGNGYACDCLVFGDPVLEMANIDSDIKSQGASAAPHDKEKRPMQP